MSTYDGGRISSTSNASSSISPSSSSAAASSSIYNFRSNRPGIVHL
jgi:hypothetical protein